MPDRTADVVSSAGGGVGSAADYPADMARILALSSQVVSGHVGLSAIVPPLQRLGHEVLAMPTVLLSNHPGNPPSFGVRVDPATLDKIVDTLDAGGRLDGVAAVLTGYLPSIAHVATACVAIARCRARNKHLVVLCDPVIGDDPKGIYIDAGAAAAIRDILLPEAAIVTPNRFELAWLSRRNVVDEASAIDAARSLQRPLVIATSIPAAHGRLANLAITAGSVDEASVAIHRDVPNGTGDLFAGLFLSAYLSAPCSIAQALAQAVAEVERVIAASAGKAELQLTTIARSCSTVST